VSRRKLTTQPRLVGERRQPVSSAFMAELERAVRREMARFHVSRSFVIATAVADALGVESQPHYAAFKPGPKLLRIVGRR
jgi:hypothetical protein